MRKLILIAILMMLAGCTNTVESKKVNDSFGEKLLNEVQASYENDFYSRVLLDVEADFDKVQDKSIKKNLRKLCDKATLKILKNKLDAIGTPDIQILFFPNYEKNRKLDFNNMKFSELLSENVKHKVVSRVIDKLITPKDILTNPNLDISEKDMERILNTKFPTYNVIKKQNLKLELVENYKDKIKKGISRYDAVVWLDNHGIKYNYVSKDLSSFVVLTDENMVLEVDDRDNIDTIFKIKDKNGNVVSPFAPLKEEDERRAKIEKQRLNEIAEEVEKQNQEQEEQKEVKIGMTEDEVVDRMGQPETVNRTTTSYGVSEQWVYSNGKYLYFEDGILDTIQD